MAPNPKLDAYRALIKTGDVKDDFLSRGFYAIEGQIGSGKTTLAATISDFFPAKPGIEHVILSDLAWVAVDTGAIDTLKGLKIRPAFEFDLADFQIEHGGNPVAAMQTIQEFVKELPASVSTVVFDTVSQFDVQLDAFLRLEKNRHLYATENGQNSQAFYGQIKQWHTFFHAQCRLLKKRVLYLFHTQADMSDLKAKTPDQKVAEARSEKATGMPGSPDVIMAITGASRDIYPRDMSLVLSVRNDGKGKRKVYTQVREGYQAKSRYEAMLLPEEEPNMNVILNKVRKAAGL